MASFLSFVYRRQTSAPASFQSLSSSSSVVVSPDRRQPRLSLRHREADNQHDHAPRPFLPPGVTASGSSESAGWVSPGDSSEDEGFLTTSSSPFSTPEGLLPRKSADSLRRELQLSPRTLEPRMTRTERRLSGVAKILADRSHHNHRHRHPIIANDVANDHIRNTHLYSDEDDEEEEDDLILPPPDYHLQQQQQQRQLTFDSSIKSPVISTSSFYSRSDSQRQDRPVAMSPVLQVGQARTAVGALVALREAANNTCYPNHPVVSAMEQPYHHPPSPAMMKQSSDKLQKPAATKDTEKQAQTTSKQLPSVSMSVLPPTTDLVLTENNHQEKHGTEDENIPYIPVNTPVRRSSSIDHDDEQVQRVISKEDDDLYASPSSMQLPQVDLYYEPLSAAAQKGMETPSFSSSAGLIRKMGSHQESYDFGPILPSHSKNGKDNLSSRFSQPSSKSSLISVGKVEESDVDDEGGVVDAGLFDEEAYDGALMARKYKNQQLRRHQIQLQKFEEFFKEKDIVEDETNFDDHPNSAAVVPFDEDRYAIVSFEEALVRRKARNQRHEKETFLLDLVARLRDNLELVADIEDAASSTLAAMGNWFVKTPMDEENLMTGFSGEQRNTLVGSIESILQEMAVAQHEEFILSPSKVPVMAATHDTLTQALHFCRALIASAIPLSEKNKMVSHLPSDDPLNGSQRLFLWKCLPELHSALGLFAPQSPDTVRGGGTSLFSLPEQSGAETPHTSNLSMATSITSAYTPHKRRSSSQPMRPQLILQHDGLQLRHTVEVVSSLIQKLTLACVKLKELNSKERGVTATQTYVRACEEIKQNYLQLLVIKKEDARALSDIFYLESLAPQPTTTAGNILLAREVSADEDDPQMAAKTSQVVALASALAPITSFPEQRQSRRRYRSAPALSTKSILHGRSNADSAANYHSAPLEYDDLRRQVGSYDRDEDDCNDEQRDGPAAPFDDYGSRDSGESEWSRRMYHNVSIAASSIRKQGESERRE